MNQLSGVLVVILSLIAGFGGGWAYQAIGGGSASSSSGSTSSTADATQTLEECLTDVWGEDKYAAITANSSLATTEDNFQALSCYEAK